MEGCQFNLIVTNVLTTQHHSTITPKSKLHCLNLSIFFENRIGVISLSSDVDFGGIQYHLY